MLSLLLNLASLAISVAFPAITTYKALNIDNQSQLKSLSIYWFVLTIVTTIDSQLYFVLRYFPLYSFIKLYISFWLVLPNTKGAEYIYYNVLDPFLNEHVSYIERWINEFKFNEFISTLLVKISNSSGPKSQSNETDKERKGIFEDLINRLYKDDGDSNSKANENLVSSLFGVLRAFSTYVSDSGQTSPEQGAISGSLDAQKLTEKKSKTESVSSENTPSENDFAVVNTKDIEDFKPAVNEETGSSETQSGWFSFWGAKPKEKSS